MSTTDSPATEDNGQLPEWEGEAPTNYRDFRSLIATAMQAADVNYEVIAEVIKTADTAVIENEDQLEWEEDLPSIQAELKRMSEGVSVSLYETSLHQPAKLLDEAWWTWGEFTGINTRSLPISAGGTTVLEPPESDRPTEEPDAGNLEADVESESAVNEDGGLQYHIDLESPSVEEMTAVINRVDEIIENQDFLCTEARDPFIVIAGDPPNYNDRLPYDDVCEEHESDLDLRIVSYSPRAWDFLDDGSLILHDGTNGCMEGGETEFQVRVDPEDLDGFWAI